MSAPAGTQTEDPKTGEPAPSGEPAGAAPEGEKDWKAEFEAQQRINRDIERRSAQTKKDLETKLAAATAPKPAEGKPADDKGPDLKALRDQIMAETQAATLKERAMDKVETKAAKLFQNPEDARTFLAGRVEDFITDGKVDMSAVNDALADLLKERPYLGVAQGTPAPAFQGTGDGGPRGTAGKPQMTKDEMQALYKAGKHEEIEAARKAGQLNDLLGVKS